LIARNRCGDLVLLVDSNWATLYKPCVRDEFIVEFEKRVTNASLLHECEEQTFLALNVSDIDNQIIERSMEGAVMFFASSPCAAAA
jgi:hypothetical protein